MILKFLPPELVTPNIIPLNFIYDKGKENYKEGEYDPWTESNW